MIPIQPNGATLMTGVIFASFFFTKDKKSNFAIQKASI